MDTWLTVYDEYESSRISDDKTVGQLRATISEKLAIKPSDLKITITASFCGTAPAIDSTWFPDEKEDSQNELEASDGLDSSVEKFFEACLEKNRNTTSSRNSQLDKQRKIEAFKINEINQLNFCKKLLVLRCEGILTRVPPQNRRFPTTEAPGHKRPALARRYVHEFLSRASAHYNIVIWSRHSMEELVEKLTEAGIFNSENYEIAFCLDRDALMQDESFSEETKLLSLIWRRYAVFSSLNTVLVDNADNSKLRGQSVVTVRESPVVSRDRELLKLGAYLELIAEGDDFTALVHTKWSETVAIGDNKSLEEEKLECSNFGACQIVEVTPIVRSKKLLIFNLDQVMFNPICTDAVRVHFQDFFASVCAKYNIAIWSRENRGFMNQRGTILGFNGHSAFNISLYLNYRPENSGVVGEIRAKVLNAVSNSYPEYGSHNTIIVDRHRFNVNGLANKSPMKVRFMQLAVYLNWATTKSTFEGLKHDHWLTYVHNVINRQRAKGKLQLNGAVDDKF